MDTKTTPALPPNPRAHIWELTGKHPDHCNGQRIKIMGSETRFQCRMELDRRIRQGWTELEVHAKQ